MKFRYSVLAQLIFWLVTLPALADTLYTNGPIEGSFDAWTINFGFAVSDTFTLQTDASVTGLQFGLWLFPGDLLESAEVLIGTAEFDGTISDQVVAFTASDCFTNHYGFDVCIESGQLSPVNLAAGSYWVTLQNAVVNNGDPVYWDENLGPSLASENSLGSIPSEAFTLTGMTGGTTTTSSGGTVPEPGNITLFASGILALAGVLRRNPF